MVALVRPAYRVFWAEPAGGGSLLDEVREVPASVWGPMVVLALACLILGMAPQIAFGILDQAAMLLATLGI